MRHPSAFDLTPAQRASLRPILTLARGAISHLVLVDPSAAAKTAFLRWLYSVLVWPLPLGHYTRAILEHELRCTLRQRDVHRHDRAAIIAYLDRLGVSPPADRPAALALADWYLATHGAGGKLSGPAVAQLLAECASRSRTPPPDPHALLPLFQLTPPRHTRYPILLPARPTDTPQRLLQRLMEATVPSDPQILKRGWTEGRLLKVLRWMPVLVLVDEADALDPRTLRALRQFADETRTPVLYAGTPPLLDRLRGAEGLWSLADRPEYRLEITPPTLDHLARLLPEVPADLRLLVWDEARGVAVEARALARALLDLAEAQPRVALQPIHVRQVAQARFLGWSHPETPRAHAPTNSPSVDDPHPPLA